MALIDDVRQCLRVTSTLTDAEIQMWIAAALADMRRCGVHDELLVEETMCPLAKSAVTCFVKAQYGYDNNEAERFLESYRMMLVGLLNSKANDYLFPDAITNQDCPGLIDSQEPNGEGANGGD